jgi:hypothetical protein
MQICTAVGPAPKEPALDVRPWRFHSIGNTEAAIHDLDMIVCRIAEWMQT